MHGKVQEHFKNIIQMAVGTAIFAFGLHYFVIPNELMEGGITGVALLLHYSLGFPPSISSLLINIPLFFIGWRYIGRRSMTYTMIGTFLLSVFLWIMERLLELGWLAPFETKNDYILAALYAGVTIGCGLGIVFHSGGTTGGSDIIARIVNKKRGWSIGRIILVIDLLVILTSLLYIPIAKVLYTMVAVFVASQIIDFIQEGAYAAKAFTIISNQSESLAAEITTELDRGVTLIPAFGAYSKQAKQMLYCVVSRQEARRLTQLVKRIDPTAFVIISEVHDVLGEGFRLHD